MSRTALVLGAGGLPGEAFEAGVLSALHESLGWDARDADVIVGTSAGSQVGTMLRCGLAPEDLFAFVAERELSEPGRRLIDKLGEFPGLPLPRPPQLPRLPSVSLLAQAARHPWKSRAGLIAAALPTGTYPTEQFAEALRRLTGTVWPTQDLWLVAARLPLCERVVFGRTGSPECDIPMAAAASCAIPGFFAPVEIEDHRYVDGGIHSPTNADLLVDEDVDMVIVVSPMSTNRLASVRSRPNPFRVYFRALLGAEVRRLRKQGKQVIVFQPGAAEQKAMGINAFAQWRCPRVAELARDSVLAWSQMPKFAEQAQPLAA